MQLPAAPTSRSYTVKATSASLGSVTLLSMPTQPYCVRFVSFSVPVQQDCVLHVWP